MLEVVQTIPIINCSKYPRSARYRRFCLSPPFDTTSGERGVSFIPFPARIRFLVLRCYRRVLALRTHCIISPLGMVPLCLPSRLYTTSHGDPSALEILTRSHGAFSASVSMPASRNGLILQPTSISNSRRIG